MEKIGIALWGYQLLIVYTSIFILKRKRKEILEQNQKMVGVGCKYWTILIALLLPLCSMGQATPSTTTVKVVSWNIQMLPNALGMFSAALRKKQRIRTPWIVEYCKEKEYDVIVFQEVFDLDITRKLKKELKDVYPYHVDTKKLPSRLTSNGIFIVSRLPMKDVHHIIYAKGAHEDGWSSEGCTLVEVEKDGKRFQIAGTHLQAGGSDAAIAHRDQQYKDIRTLMDRNKEDHVPVLVMGDMNTSKSNAEKYPLMIETLEVQDFPLDEEEPYTVDGNNSWNNHTKGIQLDYIMLQARTTATTIVQQKIIRPKQEWKGKQIDLADHYGVVADVTISN